MRTSGLPKGRAKTVDLPFSQSSSPKPARWPRPSSMQAPDSRGCPMPPLQLHQSDEPVPEELPGAEGGPEGRGQRTLRRSAPRGEIDGLVRGHRPPDMVLQAQRLSTNRAHRGTARAVGRDRTQERRARELRRPAGRMTTGGLARALSPHGVAHRTTFLDYYPLLYDTNILLLASVVTPDFSPHTQLLTCLTQPPSRASSLRYTCS